MTVDQSYYRQIITECIAWVEGPGTGFFITHDLLLTCTHVVENRTTVSVRPFGSSEPLVADVLPGALPVDDGDIALLRIKDPDAYQYAVLLHMLRSTDFPGGSRKVVLAGFPRDALQETGSYQPVPASVHPSMTGPHTLSGLIVDVDADVAKGLSGSPVLDLETGTVVGITRYRKGPQNVPAGGGAVPIARAVEAFPQVRAAYDRPPEATRQWLNQRGDDELRAIGRERRGTTGRFDLKLTGNLEEWSVHAQDDSGPHKETIQLTALGVNVTRAVFQWTRGHHTPSGEDLQLAGEILTAALLHHRVGELYKHWHGTADEVTIRLVADPACELADLPWELAQNPVPDRKTLGLDEKLALVRVMPGDVGPVSAPEPPATATGIGLIVQPDPNKGNMYPPVLSDIPWPGARELARTLAEYVSPPLDFREQIVNPSRSDLENLSGQCDILHYQGFAQVTRAQTQLSLYSDITNTLIAVEIRDVAAVAKRLGSKVVVIEAHAAPASQYSRDDPALSLAEEFLKAGVLAVVTTRYPVNPIQANLFNKGFYAALRAGLTVEMAAQAGRRKVSFDSVLPDKADYGAFVLWTADVSGLRLVAGGQVRDGQQQRWDKGSATGRQARPARGRR